MKDNIRSDQSLQGIYTEDIKGVPQGALDGFTLFRFAHMWRQASSGGVEAYLRELNRVLLERNRMRILQMYVTLEIRPFEVEIEQLGRGELVWIPSLLNSNQEQQKTRTQRLWAILRRLNPPHFIICHDILLSTLANYQIDLAVFHWISEDSRIVLNYLNDSRVPFVVVNHFHNERLKRRMIRNQVSKALAIGGVSGADVPNFIRSRFTNLSDAVDTDFFHPKKANPLEKKIEEPLILLPSRITKEKGHVDAVRALGRLVRAGVSAILAFAGPHGNSAFMKRLEMVISDEGVRERVIFAGELCPQELRNWYAASDVVILPSYSEGLGRVLLEAQAMERPILTYGVGGVREAVKDGETGFVLSKGDINGLSVKLRYLLKNKRIAKGMGISGRLFTVRKFSLDALTRRHELFYKKAFAHMQKS